MLADKSTTPVEEFITSPLPAEKVPPDKPVTKGAGSVTLEQKAAAP